MPPERRPEGKLIETIAYWTTTYDVPFCAGPNRRSGRWNVAGETCVQYLCCDSDAPWAEMVRALDLRSHHDVGSLRATMWQVRVADQPIADYGTFDKAAASGFPAEALVEDDHERCQQEARRLGTLGFRGILAPSAALPGSQSLTLFGPRVQVPWNTTLRTVSTLPAQAVATGHPPRGILERTRYRGQVHGDLARYVGRRSS